MCLIEHYKAKETNLFIHFRIQSICILFTNARTTFKSRRRCSIYKSRSRVMIKRSNDIDEDEKNIQAFLKDKKNLDEHDFVVKSILDDIKPYVDNIEYNHSPNILKTTIYIIYILKFKVS